ncbi:hypothetical protein HN031_07975 [Nocardioides sp. zg-1308]|uniref:hypothetical protein n=1 Tax=Nocardioides sp. zg-1308 TaxID=2736253 RepID=UPI001552443B|nr:hypothetical protein [Nocardioides sp. zg-1308]NPD04621.1 hypothetical protein [Nocardioides sp. zg-1308]
MKLVISLAATVVALTSVPAAAVPTDAVPGRSADRAAAAAKAVVTASAEQVTEGDSLTLRVKVPTSKDAKKVVLEERRDDVFGDPTWDRIDGTRAKARLAFATTVTAQNEATYRVTVTYRGREKPVASRPVTVTVWRWIALQEFEPYLQSSTATYTEADINGTSYAVWGGYGSTARSWEARVTPGRNCTKFRAVLGLSDGSDDGSSGVVSFTSDEATTVYQSPSLVPGMTVPVALDLAAPYRFGMSATNTSADKVRSYPMVADGAFYCTGIED